MNKRILITGISGFAGSHLAEYLVSQNSSQIFGTYLNDATNANLKNIQDGLTLKQCDLTDFASVKSLIAEVRPDEIYHLAAFPSPADSFKDPSGFMQNNINAELFILEALRGEKLFTTKVLVISSAEIYGSVDAEDLPMDEATSLNPVSPYGVSKIAQDFLGLQYFNAYGMPVIRVRPFGHIGPRLSPQFATSAFAKKIAEIEKGNREPILTVGNLDAKRDITDVRDMVKAYSLMMEKGKAGDVYNLGSGKAIQTKEILDTLLSFSTAKIEVKTDESLLRPNDIPELRCDNTKMKNLTNWEATISLETSLKDTLEYWRTII